MVRVLLADDQALTAVGIQYLLEKETGYQVVGQVSRWQKLLSGLQQASPDMLVLDYLRLSGFSLTSYQQLREQYPELRLFILTADTNQQRMLAILQRGVSAFLTKNCSEKEITQAFRAVQENQKFYCSLILDLLTHPDRPSQNTNPVAASLSVREQQIILRIAQDYSTQEIAQQLALSPHTINAHRKRILRKLGVTSPVGLLLRSLHLNVIRIEGGQAVLTSSIS